VAGSCEPSGCINDGKFIDQLSDKKLLKKHSAPWSCVSGHRKRSIDMVLIEVCSHLY
jgi:hypothetical protein